MKKITLLTSLGTAIEFYDFIIFILFASYISQVFFPESNAFWASFETLLIFAVSYFFRPIGGFIMGIIGDKYGRKKVFLASITMMAVGTLGIGLLPTYEQIGVTAIGLLCAFRILQGLSQGAELPGAIIFISEHAQHHKRGFHLALMFMAVSIGSYLGTITHYTLTYLFSEAQMLAWGWRIPFLFGGFILIIGSYLRRNTYETPVFAEQRQQFKKTPLNTVFKYHWRRIIIGIGITIGAASLVVFGLYTPTFASKHFGYSTSEATFALSQIILASLMVYPFMGLLADAIERRKLLIGLAIIALLIIPTTLNLLATQTTLALYLFLGTIWLTPTFFVCAFPVMLAELFPTEVRYTGVALCYNLSYALAALVPAGALLLIESTQNPLNVQYIFMSLISLTLLAAFFTQDKRGLSLRSV